MALVVVEVNPLGAVTSATIRELLKQWNNSNDFAERQKFKNILTPHYNAQIINLANKGDVNAQKFQTAYISAEAATAAIEPVSTTSTSTQSSHAGSSGRTTTSGSSSSHTGSSSSHTGARTTTTTTTSTSSTTTDGGTTATPTTEATAVQVPENANPFVEPTVSSRTGQTQYYVSSLDPNAGSWTFQLNNGTDYTTANWEEAQLIEAALYYVGKGPRNSGANAGWDSNGVTYYTYEEAWQAYEQRLAQTLQRLANNGNTTENGQMNEQALLAAMMQQQQQNQEATADDLTEYNYDTTPAQTKKKNTWLWWLLGGAVGVSAILIYRSNKKRR